MRAATLLLLAASAALAAPVPPRRPAAAPVTAGRAYRVRWSGAVDFVMVFRRGGEYECYRPGRLDPEWVGDWRVEGPALWVRERRPDADPGDTPHEWHHRPGDSPHAFEVMP